MSKQADFHVTTHGGDGGQDQTVLLGELQDWLDSQEGSGGGSGGGLPFWPFSSELATAPQNSPTSSTPHTKKAMAIDPSLAYIIAQLAGPMLAGAFGGSDQPRQSFEGKGAIDPSNLMRSNLGLATRMGQAITDHLAQPVSLPSAYAQTPGAYSGGGLPMPIGVSAEDPALANPALLTRPGMSEFANIFSGLNGAVPSGDHTDAPGVSPDGYTDTDPYDTSRTAVPKDASAATASEVTGPRRRSAVPSEAHGQLVRANDLIDGNNPGDDLTKGLGAVKLLLEAYS